MSSASIDQDAEYLKLLSIFHYVVGGLAMMFACIPFLHLFVGVGLASGGFDTTEAGARAVGVLIAVLAALFILAGWTFAVALVIAGRFLATRRHRTYCLVMAAVACIFMPFGTVLGVLTIIVLMRPSVQRLFTDGPSVTAETAAR
jgi:hypothetical protein